MATASRAETGDLVSAGVVWFPETAPASTASAAALTRREPEKKERRVEKEDAVPLSCAFAISWTPFSRVCLTDGCPAACSFGAAAGATL